MFDGFMSRILFCIYITWCRENYKKNFCIPYYDQVNFHDNENTPLSILYDLKHTNNQFYHLHYRGEYNDTKPYLNIIAS